MKKLSIVLALIMALSCFCFTAFAAVGDDCDYTDLNNAIVAATKIDTKKYTVATVNAFEEAFDAAKAVEEGLKVDAEGKNQAKIDAAAIALEDAIAGLKEKPTSNTTTTTTQKPTTTKAAPVKVNVTVVAKDINGNDIASGRFPYSLELNGYTVGSTIKAETIINLVKAKVDATGTKIIDTEEFVVSDVVVLKDAIGTDGTEVTSVTLGNDRASYDFVVYIFEINDVENLAQVAATELAGKVDWKGIASANTGLINQVINGAKAAADSLAKADYPEIGEKKTEDAANKSAGSVKGDKVVMTPKTGASAAAGVAVVVLALSATTAVVLRKKED